MNKKEIEEEILKEIKIFLPQVKDLAFDKALPIIRKEAWRLADKYDTTGDNIFNLMITNWGRIS